ncbi:hypothetical protein T484DRAFT_1769512 [Baffinella frigidus]|nr:hypothetical protein T484DRAFT_1769512 [Cryptophyta sp. CCMP2293]
MGRSPQVAREGMARVETLHVLLDRAFTRGCRRAELLCVPEPEAACHEYLKMGFRFELVLAQYYVDGGKARPAALLAIGEAHAHEARRIRGAWLERSSFKGGISALPPGEPRQFSVSFEEFHIGLQFTQVP